MAFHDVQLPTRISAGAKGGPGFKTTVLQLANGLEKRNIDWSVARQRWDVAYGLNDQTDYQELLTFFYARRGRAHSFRFKDWSDYALAEQTIGQNDGSTTDFQIYKRYTNGGVNFDRNLTKIVSGSVTVKVNSVTIAEGGGAGDYAIDLTTGIITLGATLAAASGQDVDVACEFDVPVRFDIDRIEVEMKWEQLASVGGIPVLEVVGE